MTPAPRRFAPMARTLVVAVAASASLAATGCGGDNPARMAGTIEVPANDPGRFDAKSFTKGQANVRKPAP